MTSSHDQDVEFGYSVDYIYDFVPDIGIRKTPALFVEKRDPDFFHYDSETVEAIPKNKLTLLGDGDVKKHEGGDILHLTASIYKELASSREAILSPSSTRENLQQLKYAGNHFQVRPGLKQAIESALRLGLSIDFDGDRIVLEIRPMELFGKEFVDVDLRQVKDVRSPTLIRGYHVFFFYNYKNLLKNLTQRLAGLGFKKAATTRYFLDDWERIPDLLAKLKRQKSIAGVPFRLGQALRDVKFSGASAEPLVSVRLDEGKSLVFLDVKYYHNRQEIDPAHIQEAISKKRGVIKIGDSLIRIDHRKAKSISEKAQDKKVLPLEKFYQVFEVTRQVKGTRYSQGYHKFFASLGKVANLPKPPKPRYLRKEAIIYKHQKVGFAWLSHLASKKLNGILADEMGLGKTLQALLTIFASRNLAKAANVVIVPKSLVENWRSEIEHFFRFKKVKIHFGSDRPKSYRQSEVDGAIILSTYDIIRRDFKKFLHLKINYLVLDEAQKIKNQGAQTARAVKIIPALHRVALSGTPLENRLSELWSLFDFLMPGFWGSYREFRKQYEVPIVVGKSRQALSELHRVSRPFILRRRIDKVLRLPRLIPAVKTCDLYSEQLGLYKELIASSRTKKIVQALKAGKMAPQSPAVLVLIQKLRMVCSHPDLIMKSGVDGKKSGKMQLLFQVLQDLTSDKQNRILVFVEFYRNFAFIAHWLEENGISHVMMRGDSGIGDRNKSIADFNEGRAQVFLVGLKVGGLGLNLTKANYVLLFDRWWNPAVEDQAVARAHRIGQTRTVTAYRFVTKGTIEERLEELHVKKRELFTGVLETERVVESLGKEDVIKLLSSPDASASVEK